MLNKQPRKIINYKGDKMKRASGILMHISSLPGDYSIGSFGEEAKQFIDFLKKAVSRIGKPFLFVCRRLQFAL